MRTFTQAEKTRMATYKPEPNVAITRLRRATIEGMQVVLYKTTSTTNSAITRKTALLASTIKALKAAGVMFENDEVKEFRVEFCGKINGSNTESFGKVWFDGGTKPGVLLRLGTRIDQHIISGYHRLPEKPMAGGTTGSPARVLADRIYDYYKPTWTITAKEKCGYAQALHEWGHIFHQLNSPTNFWMNADIIKKKTDNYTPAHHTRIDLIDTIHDLACAHVSEYAGKKPNHLNEFVAEVFAGIMLGVRFDELDTNILEAYTTVGGTAVPSPRSKLKRHNTFVTQVCNCPNANTKKYSAAAKIQLYT